MVLKAVLFGFNGIIINDEDIRQSISDQILLTENLRPDQSDYIEMCLGRSDRACIHGLLSQRGRSISPEAIDSLISARTSEYQSWLDNFEKPPIYAGVEDLIFRCRTAHLQMAIVTGSTRKRVSSVLSRSQLAEHFSVVVSGDDVSIAGSKPAPDGYLKAIEQLQTAHPELCIESKDCLAIEDSFPGIQAAKAANVPVVGVAHTYPNHMLQRRATWVVDYLREIKFDWISERFGGLSKTSADSTSDEAKASIESEAQQ